MLLSPDAWTAVVFRRRNGSKIPWNMKSTHRFPLQGDNVINLMMHACFLGKPLGLSIDGANFFSLLLCEPRRGCVSLPCAPRCPHTPKHRTMSVSICSCLFQDAGAILRPPLPDVVRIPALIAPVVFPYVVILAERLGHVLPPTFWDGANSHYTARSIRRGSATTASTESSLIRRYSLPPILKRVPA